MFDNLKEMGRTLGRGLGHTWESLSEGWRELFTHSRNALTLFARGKEGAAAAPDELAQFPQWGMLAGEIEETEKDVMVRVELPGINKEDCHISIEGNTLYISGEKRCERETHDSTYYLMERAYGSFQRAVPLPGNVDPDKAAAHYRNGVLTVRIPRLKSERHRVISVS